MDSKIDFLLSDNFRFNKYNSSTFEIDENTKYDFGVIAGKLNLNTMSKITDTDELEDIFHGHQKTNTNFEFNNIQFHDNIERASSFQFSSLIRAVFFQSSIFHLYGINQPYDFLNNPNLIVDNGFAVNKDVLSQSNLDEKINDILKNIDVSEVSHLNDGDTLWLKCYLNLDSPSFNILDQDDNKTIYFLIGFSVFNETNAISSIEKETLEITSQEDIYITGTINTTLDVNNVMVSVFNREMNLIGNTISTNGKDFILKNISKKDIFYISCHKKNSIVTEKKRFNFFLSAIVMDEQISINPINTIISEFSKYRDFENLPALISQCLQRLGVTNQNFDVNEKYIKTINKAIELFIYSTSNFVANTKDIYGVLSNIINENDIYIDLLSNEFVVIFLSAIESIYGIIAERAQLFQTLSLISRDIEYSFGNFVLSTLEKTPIVRESLFTFRYIVDSENLTKEDKRVVTDFVIDGTISNDLLFYPNEFFVDWENSVPKSSGASSINFFVGSNDKIKITPISKRAKRYKWVNTDNHSFNTLLKCLFGELLLGTRVVPVEMIDGGEFNKSLTEESLTRVMKHYKPSYFGNEHDKIIRKLKQFYVNLWTNNENAYASILNTEGERGVFNSGDILKIPVDIVFRYKIQNSFNKETEKNKVVEGVWNLMYNFKVV